MQPTEFIWEPQTGTFRSVTEQTHSVFARLQGMRRCGFNPSVQSLTPDIFASRLQDVFASAQTGSARCMAISNLICKEFGGDPGNWTESQNPCQECVQFANNKNISRLELTNPQLFRCTCASGLRRGNEQVSGHPRMSSSDSAVRRRLLL